MTLQLDVLLNRIGCYFKTTLLSKAWTALIKASIEITLKRNGQIHFLILIWIQINKLFNI